VRRIGKMIYLKHGLSPDGNNDDESTADDNLDIAVAGLCSTRVGEEARTASARFVQALLTREGSGSRRMGNLSDLGERLGRKERRT